MAEPEEEPRKPPAGYVPSTSATPRPKPAAPKPAPPPPGEAPAEKPAPVVEKAEAEPREAEPSLDRGASLGERLATAQTSQLRARRERIDKRLVEIAQPIGQAALELGGPIHGTRIVDIDRILK